jgi:hypothetical protein
MNILKKIKTLNNEENKTIIIGLLTILIGLWLIIYLIPSFFVSLFNTILGNIILFVIVILVGINNYKYGLILALILIILIRFVSLIKEPIRIIEKVEKEGFELSQKSINDFLQVQHTINPKIVFDMEVIKKEASQEELDYFLKNGMWPWSEKVIDLYEDAVNKNQLIRTYSGDSVNYARKIYNEKAILQIMKMETNEGRFLLSGVQINDGKKNELEDLPSGFGDFGYESGLTSHMYPVIRCKIDDNGNSSLEKTTYTGKGGIFGEQTSITSKVDYNNLENEIPGFKFLNGPCDPCKAINSSLEYSCPFSLDLKEEKEEKEEKEKKEDQNRNISKVWEYLWGTK